jgi:hypothetical protein
MKHVASLLLLFSCAALSLGQTDGERAEWAASVVDESKLSTGSEKDRILKFDFGSLWTRAHDNPSVLGYIGDDHQRLRIVILSAKKDPKQSDTYNVSGKSMVKNVVRAFAGTMKITKVSSMKMAELDEDYKADMVREAGIVFGEYHFAEDTKLTNTGAFDGFFVTDWIVDRNGRLQYDEVLMGADAYRNNQFTGTWISYRIKTKKPAGWGDSRIPLSGDLDVGDGEFSPNDKYLRNGWQSYRDAYTHQNRRALMEENRQWWK